MTSAHVWNEYLDEQAAELQRKRIPDDPSHAERIEVVLYRDPDGCCADGVDVQVFIGGEPVEVRLFVVDPGAGYRRSNWDRDRDIAVQEASPAAAKVIRDFYDTGSLTEFVEDDREVGSDG